MYEQYQSPFIRAGKKKKKKEEEKKQNSQTHKRKHGSKRTINVLLEFIWPLLEVGLQLQPFVTFLFTNSEW